MFDKFNLGDMGKMFEEVQKQATAMNDEYASKTYSAKSGGGMIEATINGKGEMIDLNIDDSLLDDKDALQILLMGTISDLFKMVEDDKKNSLVNMMGGMNPFGSK